MADGTVSLMSQPPVGSTIAWKIYERFGEKWILEDIYQELSAWNGWWLENRLYQDYLTWGGWKGADTQIAAWESGLDNSPMYNEQKMVHLEKVSLLDLADVGLMSLYVMDCQSMARIAKELGKKNEAKIFADRAKKYSDLTAKLWNEEEGIYLNRTLSSGEFSKRLSPTLFYPMLGDIPTKSQVTRMLDEHYLDVEEFYGEYVVPSLCKERSRL